VFHHHEPLYLTDTRHKVIVYFACMQVEDRLKAVVKLGLAETEGFITRVSKYPNEKPESCSEKTCLPYNVLILGRLDKTVSLHRLWESLI